MDELLRTDEGGNQTVSARELHTALGVGKDFSTWIKDRFEKYGFEEGKSYSPILGNRSDGLPGKPKQEYLLTISTAKEIAMVENNEQGRKIRQYLIKVEEAWNEPALVMARALQVADRQVKALSGRVFALEHKVEEDRPKVELAERMLLSEDVLSLEATAKSLKLPYGVIKFAAKLRDGGILMTQSWNLPYQKHVDAGYLVVVNVIKDCGGAERIFPTTRVTPRGLLWLSRTRERWDVE